ncbi:TLC domain-containing protein 1 [Amia ocellicauda]|uniref:TLC domain-containing protein 1 n=1 Tax=Amia ocellicauda TaxID=2972642 RepID=UPI00346389CB
MELSWMSLQNHPTLSVAMSSVTFRIIHRLLQGLPLPKAVERDAFKSWKWRNLSVSLVHSLLTGPWAVTCVILWPDLLHKIHSFYTPLTYLLICVSSGYFIQDAGDIILSGQARASWEFLLHHALVTWCFLYGLYTKHYVAGAVIALFVEVNSIFLHTRLLLKLACAQASPLYHINKLLNLFTYVFFRLSAQFYITWYLLRHYATLDHAGYFLATMTLMNIMILIYFYRLLRADFLPRSRKHCAQNGTRNDKFVYD